MTEGIFRSCRRLLPYAAALGLTALVSAEAAARVQDYFREGTPLTAVPSWDRDLFVDTASGRRGRPGGRYKKWVLNDFGFRAGPMSVEPEKGRTRVVVLGASETFGLYESPANEFPAQLSTLLAARGRYEVINAALTGLTLRTTVRYWNDWVSRFRPDIVVIYPSPLFYLADDRRPPAGATPAPSPKRSAAGINPDGLTRLLKLTIDSSRVVERARQLLDVPDPIQRIRDARTIDAATRGTPDDWLFQTVPQERVDRLLGDLDTLVSAITRTGARAIVLTHATRTADPPRPQDDDWLWRARVNTPRATPRVIGQFNSAINDAIRAWAARRHVALVDVAAGMNGREELFGDLIHFNDAGAAVVARAIADAIH